MRNLWLEYRAVKEHFPVDSYVTVQNNVCPVFRISPGPHRVKGYFVFQNTSDGLYNICLEINAEQPTIIVSGYCFPARKP